ncbi:chromate transporter [Paenibacillus shirakamiensis]|uniref:Chromate transporter n=1 Tax=Paenibacillus shirakamiensis TaxID=1265935 RepID=A0ABS4JEE3_9BACL|nr:chromate transporter [Paenibacillus shirakamiensis]
MRRYQVILQLFGTFLRIGPSTFGGGYAMIPTIEREVMERRNWIDEQEMSNLISLSGSAPGGIGVNAAAFVGYRKAGLTGAVAAVLGITLPTFLIAIVLSFLYLFFQDNIKVQAALKGIHGAVLALILMAAYRMSKQAVLDIATACLTLLPVLILFSISISPLYIIGFGILAGILLIKGKKYLGMKVCTERENKLAPDDPDSDYSEYYI